MRGKINLITYLLFCLIICILFQQSSLAQADIPVTLIGSCDTPGNAYGVTISGNYAYVADRDAGLQIIDISNPVVPFPVGGYMTMGSACSVAVSGNYAYVADWDAGLQIINISNPASPFRVGGYGTSNYTEDVSVSGSFAYIADCYAGLQIINISNPSSPFRVGGYDTSGVAYGIAISGNYACMADREAGLQIVNISNPSSPIRIGGYDTTGYAEDVAVSGSYAYVADYDAGLQIIDISSPALPVRVGGYDTSGYAHSVAISGNYAYVADRDAGLQIIDISNPASPVRVGGYDTSGSAYGVAVVGNYVYVADMSAGLLILRIGEPLPQTVTIRGTVYDAVSKEPIAGADVATGTLWRKTDSFGHYELTGLRPGQITVRAQKIGYEPNHLTIPWLDAGDYDGLDFQLSRKKEKLGVMISGPACYGYFLEDYWFYVYGDLLKQAFKQLGNDVPGTYIKFFVPWGNPNKLEASLDNGWAQFTRFKYDADIPIGQNSNFRLKYDNDYLTPDEVNLHIDEYCAFADFEKLKDLMASINDANLIAYPVLGDSACTPKISDYPIIQWLVPDVDKIGRYCAQLYIHARGVVRKFVSGEIPGGQNVTLWQIENEINYAALHMLQGWRKPSNGWSDLKVQKAILATLRKAILDEYDYHHRSHPQIVIDLHAGYDGYNVCDYRIDTGVVCGTPFYESATYLSQYGDFIALNDYAFIAPGGAEMGGWLFDLLTGAIAPSDTMIIELFKSVFLSRNALSAAEGRHNELVEKLEAVEVNLPAYTAETTFNSCPTGHYPGNPAFTPENQATFFTNYFNSCKDAEPPIFFWYNVIDCANFGYVGLARGDVFTPMKGVYTPMRVEPWATLGIETEVHSGLFDIIPEQKVEKKEQIYKAYLAAAKEWGIHPSGANQSVTFSHESHSDLHVYDRFNRHIGVNYETSLVEEQIPWASFHILDSNDNKIPYDGNTPAEGLRQVINLSAASDGIYRIELIGTSNGSFTSTIIGAVDGNTMRTIITEGEITEGQRLAANFTVQSVDANMVIECEPFSSLPILDVQPKRFDLSVEPNTRCDFSFKIFEHTGKEPLHSIKLRCTDIAGTEAYIATSDVTFDNNDFDLPAAGEKFVNASVSIPHHSHGSCFGSIIVESPTGGTKAIELNLLINTPPTAVAGPDQTVFAWIDGIADVNLDGSGSNDPDGDVLTYKWMWTIDGNNYDTNGVKPSIELPVGQHVISLIVNDGLVDSEPNDVNITVIGPVKANLCVMPKVLNCKSFLPKIMITILLPKGITKDQIDTDEPLLLYPGEIEADRMWISRDYDYKCRAWRTTILAWFDKDDLMSAIDGNGKVELAVVGRLKAGQYFFGSDTVTVICPGHWPWHRHWFDHRWNRWCRGPGNFRH